LAVAVALAWAHPRRLLEAPTAEVAELVALGVVEVVVVVAVVVEERLELEVGQLAKAEAS